MSRIGDWASGAWSRLRRLAGFDRLKQSRRNEDLAETSRTRRVLYFARPILVAIVLLYVMSMVVRFSVINGDELGYAQEALVSKDISITPGGQLPEGGCARSSVAAMSAEILEVLVQENTWVPGDPQYKIGWFGLAEFESGPFFDNKASFQIGALSTVRRMSIEMVDILGRARGTSAADVDLEDARSSVQWNERAWIINPLDPRLPLLSTSAAASYDAAIQNYRTYNDKLADCAALYDARNDNLFQLLDRIANHIGGLTDQLATRSKGMRWDVEAKQMVPAEGNNLGVFDFRADNLFYEAHGLMWAYHGYLQAIRADFSTVVRDANLDQIWDRMEQHVAEAASLEPLVVSNGAEDSLVQPAHLAAMAANMLRARANMTELREILAR